MSRYYRLRKAIATVASTMMAFTPLSVSAQSFSIEQVQLKTVNLAAPQPVNSTQLSTQAANTAQVDLALKKVQFRSTTQVQPASARGIKPSGNLPPRPTWNKASFVPEKPGAAGLGTPSTLLDANAKHISDPNATSTSAPTKLSRSFSSVQIPAFSTSFKSRTFASDKRALATASVATIASTGVLPWWTYVGQTVPGVGTVKLNVANGNMIVQSVDMHVSHRDIAFSLVRTYNSQSKHDANNSDGSGQGLYGDGWTNTTDRRLSVNTAGGISYFDETGARFDYTPDGQGGWIPPAGVHTQLAWDGAQGYFIYYKGGAIDYFYSPFANQLPAQSSALLGKLRQIIGRDHNNTITFSYTFQNNDATTVNNLIQITQTAEDSTHAIQYFNTVVNGKRLLTYLVRPDGATIGYNYADTAYSSVAGTRLWLIQHPGNSINSPLPEAYAYNTPSTAVMSDLGDARWQLSAGADGINMHFTYDSLGRVINATPSVKLNFAPDDGNNTLLQPSVASGISTGQVMTMAYVQDATASTLGQSQYADSDGHQKAWTFDTVGRALGSAVYDGSVTMTAHHSFDASNNEISSTDFAGNQVNRVFDANGNVVASADPPIVVNGATFRPTFLKSYDAYSNLLASCDPTWVHAHNLDWQNGFSASDSLCPRQSGTSQYFYAWAGGAPGYLPTGHLVDSYTPLGYHTTVSYGPAGPADPGTPTAVAGSSFSQVDGSPFQAIQSFTYDSAGRIITMNRGQGNTKYTYDALGEVLSVTDPDGAIIVSNTYNPDGSLLTSNDAYEAQAKTYTYDADGNPVTSVDHTNSTANSTRKWYDGYGRLVEVQLPHSSADAYGFSWQERYLYDLSRNGTVGISDAANGNATTSFQAHGNLYKKQRFLSATRWDQVPTGSGAQWMDIIASSYDNMDRPINSYAFPPNSTVQTSTNKYDSSGRLASMTNGVGDIASYAYDTHNRVTSVSFPSISGYSYTPLSRSYAYDEDGRISSIIAASLGSETFKYDSDGHVTDIFEAPGGAVAMSSPAHKTYHYYPNGLKSSLDVASSSLTQLNMKQYVYRNDGALADFYGNYNGTNYGFHNTYTPAGRLLTKRDPLASSLAIVYNSQRPAQIDSYSIPQGQYLNISHDPEGHPTSMSLYDGSTLNINLSPRNELLAESVASNTFYSATSADGYMYTSGAISCTTSEPDSNGRTTKTCETPAWQFDARNDVALSKPTNTTVTVDGPNYHSENTTTTQLGYFFDHAGRRMGGFAQSGGSPAFKVADAENYTWRSLDNTVSYVWGPDHHLIGSATQSSPRNTMHWDGNDLLFVTSASGQVTQINFTKDATLIPSSNQLNIADRDPFGMVVSSRNLSGSDALIVAKPYSSCDDKASTPRVLRAATSGYQPTFSLCHASGAYFTMPRSDGYFDGVTALKGIRAYDMGSLTWTTPDALGGAIDSPLSQLSYSYANNNPISFADPSGLYASSIESSPSNFGDGTATNFNASHFGQYLYTPEDQGCMGEPRCIGSVTAGVWRNNNNTFGENSSHNNNVDEAPSNGFTHYSAGIGLIFGINASRYVTDSPVHDIIGAGYGFSVGWFGPIPFDVSVTHGYAYATNGAPLTGDALVNYLSGWGGAGSAFLGWGAGVGANGAGYSKESGIGDPQLSLGLSYGF